MRKVKFNCTACSSPLESPLEEAGIQFPCPLCGETLTTPGSAELAKERARQAKRIEAKNELREAAKRRKAERERRIIDDEMERQAERVADAREAQEKLMRKSSRSGPGSVATVSFVLVMMLVLWVLTIRPIQNEVNDLMKQLDDLRKVVNHNADAENWNNRLR